MTTPTPPVAASGATAMDIAWPCAREGGAIALDGFRGDRRIDTKGRGNVVTDADLAVEKRVHEILRAEYPGVAILSEETSAGTDPHHGWVWICDPIDGTKNYATGIPFWCTTIALCHDGEPVLGVTFEAVHHEGFHAEAGGGAFVNGAPLKASTRPDVDSSVLAVDLGYDDARGAGQIELMRRIFPRVQTFRILGSAALGIAYAAAGRVDLFTHLNVAPWDVAAGLLFVREAGGAASDRRGGPMTISSFSFAAGGRAVHDDFMKRYADAGGGES